MEVKNAMAKRFRQYNPIASSYKNAIQAAYGGAVVIKSADLLAHARNTESLTGDISGLAMLGGGGIMMQGMSNIAFKRGRR